MNNALDKYLTTEPDNGWDAYFEAVCDGLPEDAYRWDEARSHAPTESEQFSRMVEAMFDAGVHPGDAVRIIDKAFAFFSKFQPEPPAKRMKDFFYLSEPNGPTGHGDTCHSDADPGL